MTQSVCINNLPILHSYSSKSLNNNNSSCYINPSFDHRCKPSGFTSDFIHDELCCEEKSSFHKNNLLKNTQNYLHINNVSKRNTKLDSKYSKNDFLVDKSQQYLMCPNRCNSVPIGDHNVHSECKVNKPITYISNYNPQSSNEMNKQLNYIESDIRKQSELPENEKSRRSINVIPKSKLFTITLLPDSQKIISNANSKSQDSNVDVSPKQLVPRQDFRNWSNTHNNFNYVNDKNLTIISNENIDFTDNNLVITDNTNCNQVELNKSKNNTVEDTSTDLFKVGDSENFKEFMSTIQLTGEKEIDEEIVSFYRTKFI